MTTKGKVLTARLRHDTKLVGLVVRWLDARRANAVDSSVGDLLDIVEAHLEADRSQQAAIHEEELREARGLLGRWILVWEQGASAAGILPAATRDFLGASQQTGTPPLDPLHPATSGSR